ncbi:MAG: DUF421 domain-containing protein [Clostridia bacterium]|nr:DUF421 domain-containing protein [Clostridia bacterium]
MTTILIRTLIVYIIMISAMRLMGKRQIGELEVTDLVTTLLISEIASLPITDSSIPLSHAIIPIVILITFEICSSSLVILFPKLKNLVTARPSTLIKNGKLCRREMMNSRISLDELICELRQAGYVDIDDILYAILEKNGKLTIIPKAIANIPTCKEMNISVNEDGIFHMVIDNGFVNSHGLSEVSLSREQLDAKLAKKGLSTSDIYLMMIRDNGDERIISKKEAK